MGVLQKRDDIHDRCLLDQRGEGHAYSGVEGSNEGEYSKRMMREDGR